MTIPSQFNKSLSRFGEPKYPSLAELCGCIETIAAVAGSTLMQADEHEINARHGLPTEDGTDTTLATRQQEAARCERKRTLVVRCIATVTFASDFWAWAVAEGYKPEKLTDQTEPDISQAVWEWHIKKCPKATPCPRCGCQMERNDIDAEPAVGIAEFHGLYCTACDHDIPDDGGIPREVESITEAVDLVDVRSRFPEKPALKLAT